MITLKNLLTLRRIINKYQKNKLSETGINIGTSGAYEVIPLYKEITSAIKNKSFILALIGIGTLLDELIGALWVSCRIREDQLKGRLLASQDNLWDSYNRYWQMIESKNKSIHDLVRDLSRKNIVSKEEKKEIYVVKELIRNSFAHFKKQSFISALENAGLISKEILAVRGNFKSKITEIVEIKPSHMIVRHFAFQRLAEIFAKPLYGFVSDLIQKKKASFGPLPKQSKILDIGCQELGKK